MDQLRRTISCAAALSSVAGVKAEPRAVGAIAPALFAGHGSPFHILKQSAFTQSLRNAGILLRKPAAILVVSAHWLTESTTAILHNEAPRTIHDFSGFPAELYQVEYAAPGAVKHAEMAKALLGEFASLRSDYGLDYGCWGILRFLYPYADLPVFQVSIDVYKTPRYHLEVGRILGNLRASNVMIIGSGNIVHPERSDPRAPFLSERASEQWAADFDRQIWQAVKARDYETLCNYPAIPGAKQAVPYIDHYAPLLYVMGAAMSSKKKPKLLFEGFQRGTLSMRSFVFE
ncbi:dioxygenase family protein [Comamonas thiooxydans]|uniref:dioxygenase family protein n=1 Tax=Comamonas thiooxydans TaxID=363952 RepID=UPI000B421FD5|nr:class III extradiol ring-cleavage dioxygenase [Comamonas thiooxydans]